MDTVRGVANIKNVGRDFAEAAGSVGWWSGMEALGQVPALSPAV